MATQALRYTVTSDIYLSGEVLAAGSVVRLTDRQARAVAGSVRPAPAEAPRPAPKAPKGPPRDKQSATPKEK